MKTTNALAASMRRLLANLHPPSPPTARESQRLLDVLQSSFKSRLDEHHPPPALRGLPPKRHDHHNIPIDKGSTSSHAANVHLDSVLFNSVLGSTKASHTTEDAISKLDKLVNEPNVDILRLIALVRWYNREVKVGRQQEYEDCLRFSDRLSSWLHVTDVSSREAFLLNPSARAASLDLFKSENNEFILWTWLRLVYERRLVNADLTSPEWLDVEDHLVSGLMRLSIQRKNNTEAAQQFLEACQYRLDSGRGHPARSSGRTVSDTPYRPLLRSGRRLVSTIIYHRHDHGIDPSLFIEILQYLPPWATSPDLNYAFCAIYSPEAPSAKAIYAYLRDEERARQLVGALDNNNAHARKVVVINLLDASKLALDEGKRHSASFLLDFAIKLQPGYLPARQTEDIEPEIHRYLEFAPG